MEFPSVSAFPRSAINRADVILMLQLSRYTLSQGNMSALSRRYIACTAPQQYYLCAANGFNGCCSVDPCSLPGCPDVSDPHTTSLPTAGTKSASALSPAAAVSGITLPAPTTSYLATPLPTSMPQETSSDHSSSSKGQSTADATALQPTSLLTRASINGVLISAADIIPTSGGVIIVQSMNNGLTPARTSTFIVTSFHSLTNTGSVSRSSSTITKHTTSSASSTTANASSMATGHDSSTSTKHPVVGGAIGGAAVGALVIVAIILCCRRLKRVKRVKREQKEEEIIVDQRYVVNLDNRSR